MSRGAGAKDGGIYCTQTARSVAGRRVWDNHEQWVDIDLKPVARRHEDCIRNGAEAAARNDRYRLDGRDCGTVAAEAKEIRIVGGHGGGPSIGWPGRV